MGGLSFEYKASPFYIVDPEENPCPPLGGYATLEEVAQLLETMSYTTQACGHSWDWADMVDGVQACVHEACW